MIYSVLLFSQQDLFKNLVFEEILRERANYYLSKKKIINFWISLEPKLIEKFLKNSNFKKTNFFKRIQNQETSYVCLISTNKEFISWLKLRFGYFESLDISSQESDLEISYKDLNTRKEFYSDGIYREFSHFDYFSTEDSFSKNFLLDQYKYVLNFFHT